MALQHPRHILRAGRPGDLNFIRSSWIKSYATSHFRRFITKEIYFDNHTDLVNELLLKSLCLVASNQDDEDQIYSYCVFEPRAEILVIHYAYTKEVYRALGFCTKLIASVISSVNPSVIISTHANDKFPPLEKRFRILYNPYFLGKGVK